jgi:hypothetical protein
LSEEFRLWSSVCSPEISRNKLTDCSWRLVHVSVIDCLLLRIPRTPFLFSKQMEIWRKFLNKDWKEQSWSTSRYSSNIYIKRPIKHENAQWNYG